MDKQAKTTPWGASVIATSDDPVDYISAPGYPDVEEMLNRPYDTDKAAQEMGMPEREDYFKDVNLDEFYSEDAVSLDSFYTEEPKRGPNVYKMVDGKLTAMVPGEQRAFGLLAGLSSLTRGVGEVLGLVDEEDNKETRAILNTLEDSGASGVLASELAGSLAEPLGFAIPAAKAKTVVGLAKSGAVTGAVVGFFSPDAHDLVGRVESSIIGAGVGAVLTPAIGKPVSIVADKIAKKLSGRVEINVDDVLDNLPEEMLSVDTVRRAAVVADDINAKWMPGEVDSVKKKINMLLAGKAIPAPKVNKKGQPVNADDYNLELFKAVNNEGPDNIDHTQWYLSNLKSLNELELVKGAAPFTQNIYQPGGIPFRPPVLTREQFKAHKAAKGIRDPNDFEHAYQSYALGAKLRGGEVRFNNPAELNVWERVEAERAVKKSLELEQMQGKTAQQAFQEKPLAVQIKEQMQWHGAGNADLVQHGVSQATPQSAMEEAFKRAIAKELPGEEGGFIQQKLMIRLAGISGGGAVGYAVGGEEGALAGAIIGAAGAITATRILDRLSLDVRVPVAKLKTEVAEQSIMAVEQTMDHIMKSGIQPKAAYGIALEKLKMKHADVQEMVKLAGRKVKVTPYNVNNTEQFIISNKNSFDMSLPDSVDAAIGSMSTRIRKISEPIFGRMRKYEFNNLTKSASYIDKTQHFSKNIAKVLSAEDYGVVWHSLLNQDFDTVKKTITKYDNPQLTEGFEAVKEVLFDLNQELKAAGHTFSDIKDYFPRIVTDKNGLLKAIDAKWRSDIIKNMYDSQQSVGGRQLTLEEESKIIDQYLRGRLRKSADQPLLGAAKARDIVDLPPEFLQFYAAPEAALNSHIRRAVTDIESRKLLGRHAVSGADKFVNYEQSVGRLLAEELQDKTVPPEQINTVKNLILARLEANHKAVNKVNAAAKNLMYGMLLGNPVAAATQIGDVFMAGYAHGILNMTRAAVRKLTGKEMLRRTDMGLHDLSAELASTDSFSHFAKKTMKMFGMDTMDRIGKEVNLNAAYLKNQNLTKSPEGVKQLSNKWRAAMEGAGVNFDKMVADLRSNKVTDDIRFLMFNELSDVQPTTILEMPEMYAKHPNGRMAYALKSWSLKQIDLARRDIFQQLLKGNFKEGTSNLARFGAIIAMGGVASSTIQDLMLGKDVVMEDIPDKAIAQIWKNFGTNDYLLRQAKEGKWSELAGSILVPPLGLASTIYKDIASEGDTLDKAVQYLPGIGKLWYFRAGSGLDTYYENLERQEEQE